MYLRDYIKRILDSAPPGATEIKFEVGLDDHAHVVPSSPTKVTFTVKLSQPETG